MITRQQAALARLGAQTVQKRRTRSLAMRQLRKRSMRRNGRKRVSMTMMSPSLTSLAQPTMQPTRMIVVYGYGCDKYVQDMDERRQNLNAGRHPSIASVDVMCNDTEPHSMTYDIWKTLLRKKKLLEPTPFVKRIIGKVCQALRNGERVMLLGHSYGGSVVSRVALYLAQECPHADVDRLHIATFGSIFIPPPEHTNGINIAHYAFTNDIARFCHKLPHTCPYVTMMEPRDKRGPIASHMNYDHMIMNIARSGTL